MLRIIGLAAVLSAAAFGASAQTTPSLPDMIAAARPSVVLVSAQMTVKPLSLPGFDFTDSTPQTSPSSGTGFVVDGAQGLIVTADFNVTNSTDIKVTLSDGRELPAEVVGTDPVSDVAVLRVADHSLPALKFCEGMPRQGDIAVNLGYPFRLGLLAYAGIVSGTDIRLKEVPFPIVVLDATTHRGTAGAPVLAADGCVLGMAFAQFGADHSMPELSFGMAVPAALTRSASDEIARTGHVAHSWLGTTLLVDDEGLLVSAVSPGGPAETAGLKAGDHIYAYDGQPATDFDTMSRYIAMQPVGTPIKLGVRRDNRDADITVTTVLTPSGGKGD